MSQQEVKPEVVKAFLKKCVRIRTFSGNDAREHALVIDLKGIVDFYSLQIGSGPFVGTWEEIRHCLLVGFDQAKKSKPDGHSLTVRLTGTCPVWLAILVYSTVMFDCDRVMYCGDVLIRL
jgi:hypothetical protein